MQKREVVFRLKSREPVNIPYLATLGRKRHVPISQALAQIDGSGNSTLIRASLDSGSELGNTHYLRTNLDSKIVYAKLKDSDHYCRFVTGLRPARCRHIALILDLLPGTNGGSDIWTLRRHYLGMIAALHPGEEGFSDFDKVFWKDHAIYYAANKVQVDSLTEDIPDDLAFLR